MEIDFHKKLAQYVKDKDNESATNVIMQELAVALMKDRENFIEVLRGAGLSVEDDATDLQLINTFIDNASSNKKLLLGASYLVNHRNQSVNFDGENEVSDAGVKLSFKAMDDYFGANGEDFSYAGWSDAIKTIADVGGKITGGVMEAQGQKKRGSSMALAKQQDARREMIKTITDKRKQEADAKLKAKERAHKTQKILLIVGASVLGLVIIGGVIFALKKNK
jgi:hypothetical protein